jgi:hypothetical protein
MRRGGRHGEVSRTARILVMLVHHHCKPLLLLLVHLLLQVELRWVRDVRELRLLRMLPPTFPLAAASSASLRLRSNVHFTLK